MKSTPAALARSARYRKKRRQRIGLEADKQRARKATKKSDDLHRNEKNERRRAATARNKTRLQKSGGDTTMEDYREGIRCVTENEICNDRTRWQGPGMHREIRLEKQAATRQKRPNKMNPAQLEKFLKKKTREHETHNFHLKADQPHCWCGLCHCSACQRVRRERK